ncbi:MAG: hypothetical protein UHO61_03235 [Acutalibacteraceae bacterium]|nr:hypothetical protein [Acutalibacteraceae bacterium]
MQAVKKIRILLSFCFLALLFTLSVNAQEVSSPEEFYAEQYKNSGAEEIEESLPDFAKDYFNENGIDPSDYNWVNSLSAESVFEHILSFISSGAKAPLKAGAGIIAIVLISSALSSVEIKSSAMSAAVYAAAAASAAIIAVPVSSVINASVNALKGTGVFMLSFIPVFAVIVAASGAAVTAASMSALLLAASETVTYISSFAVLPLMSGYLALSLSGAVSPLIKKSGIAGTVKKLSLWIMAFISVVFIGILGIQTAVNASADTLVSKTAKFIIGSSVPVAGGVLSEAINTVTASMGLLKSSIGIYGALACVVTLLPLIIEILIWRAVLLISAAVSELFSLGEISGLLRAVDSMMSLLVGIMLLVGAMFIISLAAVVTGVRSL